ncbi:peptidoglycan-binding protein [Streptosporangium amethystogenes]|uniref:peptidoglycan-binding protein n=1 Tax=Streptosporangium amethystogenes TaxID=2002 RepID=UPI0004C85F4A|nr:peptidoglycan-binding protein [Streptosporangium amethystogenes]
MRKGALLSGAALLAVVTAGAAMAVLADGGTEAAAPATERVAATAVITRQDLLDTKTVTGALTYSGRRDLTTGAAGTVTWVPEDGAVVRRGRPLLKVDRRPVTLMYGRLPLYRPLSRGVSDGPDVEQLERNLRALGYGEDLTVDEHFDYATHLAVRKWQDNRGLTETGRVDDTQVVFLPSAVKVIDVKVVVGGRTAPGRQVLAVSDLNRLVRLDLDAGDQTLAEKGAKVTVELPDGAKAAGRITGVGTVAKQAAERTYIEVEITLAKDPKTRLDQAPVEVELVSERRENVLAVPVEALLALREGGFGVEVVEGSGTRLAPVKVGAFGSGMVEITGDGLGEGMKVGVPEG